MFGKVEGVFKTHLERSVLAVVLAQGSELGFGSQFEGVFKYDTHLEKPLLGPV